MISPHHAVDIGTACLKPTTRSSLHNTIRLSCQIRQNSSIGLAAACLYVRPALPAAFCSRRKLSAARPICPECPSTAHNVTATQQKHASTSTKVQRKRPSKAFKKSNSSSRGIVIQQLLRIETEGAYAGLVAGSPMADDLDSASRDSRQVTFSVSNIVRWQRRLDFLITHLTGKACSRLETTTHAILRLAVHELVFQKLPAHAISEHVNLAKALVRPAAGNLVNGVLRRLIREQEAGTLPEPPLPSADTPLEQAADMVAVATSHPTWMVQRWLQRWGQQDTLALLHHNNRSAPKYAIRVSPGRKLSPGQLVTGLQETGVEAEPSQVLPDDFLVVNGLQHLIRQGFLERGDCQVQDEAAGLVVALLDPRPGEAILDACAAPGGKALYAASRMQGQGRLVAMDINKRRLGALRTAAAAQGFKDLIETRTGDLSEYAEWVAQQAEADKQQHQYDKVLVDAPCSGLGVLAKRVDLRWRRKPEELSQLAALQARLLDAAASLVKPGGLLVYSTCSIEPEENAEQVSAFLAHHSEFQAESAPADLVPSRLVTAAGHLQTLPHLHDMDGGGRLPIVLQKLRLHLN